MAPVLKRKGGKGAVETAAKRARGKSPNSWTEEGALRETGIDAEAAEAARREAEVAAAAEEPEAQAFFHACCISSPEFALELLSRHPAGALPRGYTLSNRD